MDDNLFADFWNIVKEYVPANDDAHFSHCSVFSLGRLFPQPHDVRPQF